MTSIRAKFTKEKNSKYISHLDLMRLFKRAFNRAEIYLEHSEGFNPQPKLAFATALSLGVSSEGEYMDAELINHIEIEEFIERINSELPQGVRVVKAAYKEGKEPITALTRWGTYIIEVELLKDMNQEEIQSELDKFLKLDDINVTREKKKKGKIITKETNIRDNINKLELLFYEDKTLTIKTTVRTGSEGNLKPELLMEAIDNYTNVEIDEDNMKIHRLELFIEEDGNIITPL